MKTLNYLYQWGVVITTTLIICSCNYGTTNSNITAGTNSLHSSNTSATLAENTGMNNEFVYVANKSSNTISMYKINGGQLTPLASSTIGTGNQPSSIAVTNNGKFLYVTNTLDNSISMYTIDQSTGMLTYITTTTSGSLVSPISIAISPNNLYAYVANSGATYISMFSIDQSTGVLSSLSQATVAAGCCNSYLFGKQITVDPRGNYAYLVGITSTGLGETFAFTLNTVNGILTPKNGLINVGNYPSSVTVSRTAKFIYSTIGQGNDPSSNSNVVISKLDSQGYMSTGQTISRAGANPSASIVAPNGQYLYITNGGGNNISEFKINSSGSISLLSTINTDITPSSITIEPRGQFLYITNSASSDISIYSINQTDGTLTSKDLVSSNGINPSAITIAMTNVGSLIGLDNINESQMLNPPWVDSLMDIPVGAFGLNGYVITNNSILPLVNLTLINSWPSSEFWIDSNRSTCYIPNTQSMISTLNPGMSCSIVIHYEPTSTNEGGVYMFTISGYNYLGDQYNSDTISIPYSSRP